jgi:hypothetical protein
MIRKVPHISQATRDFDREFWQRLGTAKIFAAAWEMVVDAKGLEPDEQDIQRTVIAFHKAPR